MIELLNGMDRSEVYEEITVAAFEFQFSVQRNQSQISNLSSQITKALRYERQFEI
jgi:hypothetical protein